MTSAGIVLAGGRSRRMGAPKATIQWHGSTLLRRAAGIVARVVDGPVVVVAARGQRLPALPAGVEVAQDARTGRGPLEGLAAGLRATAGRADATYVCALDMPFQHPSFIRHVLRSLDGDHDVALPHTHGFDQPLAAAYAASVLGVLEQVIAGDDLGTRALMKRLAVRRLDAATLLADPAIAALDPELLSLHNVNTPQEYEAARARPEPSVTVRNETGAATNPVIVRAAIVGTAARMAGTELGPDVLATLDGDRTVDDPQEPLAEGDAITFAAHPRGLP
jgi:molybdenum cofactor guanylyltransferase